MPARRSAQTWMKPRARHVSGVFGAGHYIGELAPWYVAFTGLFLGAAGLLLHGFSHVSRRVPRWLLSLPVVASLVVLWEHAFLGVYDGGPISGCPDGGMFSGLFVMKFVHTPYVTQYVGMPVLARLAFHVAGASGFVAAGVLAGRMHAAAGAWGMLFAAPYAAWRSAPMWYTVVGCESYTPPSAGELVRWIGPLALEVALLVAAGALVGSVWARRSPPRPALQPIQHGRLG
jgi:hypothetical protein